MSYRLIDLAKYRKYTRLGDSEGVYIIRRKGCSGCNSKVCYLGDFCDFQNCIYSTYLLYILYTQDVYCEPTPCYGNTSVCIATPASTPYFFCINCPADKRGYRCQLGELCLIKIWIHKKWGDFQRSHKF